MRTYDWLFGLSLAGSLAAHAGCGASVETNGSAGNGAGTTAPSGGGGATSTSGGGMGGGTTGSAGMGGEATTGGGGIGGGTGGAGGMGGLPDGSCRTDMDCDEPTEWCFEPGALLCGICMDPEMPCGSDEECTVVSATSICTIPPSCVCYPGCFEGCTADSQCEESESCAADHHCKPKACTTKADCPLNFECSPVGCTRKMCKSDADCDDHCVLNRCYSEYGTCQIPPA